MQLIGKTEKYMIPNSKKSIGALLKADEYFSGSA
jgi:hypothetical protein